MVRGQVAVNASGNAIAVWSQSDGTRVNIWASRFVPAPNARWGTPEPVETDNAGDAGYAQVAMNDAGDAIVVWHQSDGTRRNVLANRYVAGHWGTPQLVEHDDAGDAGNPQVAMDPSGNAVVAWHQASRYMANHCPPSGECGTPRLLGNDSTHYIDSPQVAMDAKGNALIVWHQHDGPRSNVWAEYYAASIGWGAAYHLENDDAGDATCPEVAMNASGDAIVVWWQSDGTYRNVVARRYH
jgi:hypothetical protein